MVDETVHVRCGLGQGVIREEVWQDFRGANVEYNLSFVNLWLYGKDNGRVLGYDNNHGRHHRHFAGKQETVVFLSYERLSKCFLDEVRELRRRKEPL